jgi:hypothetical protein
VTDTGVYLYAIGRGLTPADLAGVEGVDGSPVRLVEAGDLSGVVSTVRLSEFGEEGLRRNFENLTWVEAVARAHNAVVEQCFVHGPVAPVSLATVCFDDDGVRARLQTWKEPVERVLQQVAGCCEMGVKVHGTPTAPVDAPVADPPQAASGAGAGLAYLRRRQAESNERQAASEASVQVAAQVHAELARQSVASRRHPPQDRRLAGRGDMILNGAYLVDHERRETFEQLVRRIGEERPDLQLEVTGPWPPYSFVSLDAP